MTDVALPIDIIKGQGRLNTKCHIAAYSVDDVMCSSILVSKIMIIESV